MAYYQGDYYRGDNYRGDYYRGDPFGLPLIGAIGSVAKKVVPGVVKAVKGLISKPTVKKAIGEEIIGQSMPDVATPGIIPNLPMSTTGEGKFVPVSQGIPNLPGVRLPGTDTFIDPMHMLPGGKPGIYSVPGASSGMIPKGYHINKAILRQLRTGKPQNYKRVLVKNQRMNVTNPRALRRGIRRAQGFAKLARRVLSFVSPRAPKGKAIFKRKRR